MLNDSTQRAHYRPEIDGLRAIAVIAVVLYHARIPHFSGGFAGVDVFFAISGYVVMSALRREEVQSGRIAWTRFLVRRVRRLLPMLLFTIIACLLFGYWLLPPFGDFQQLCKSAMAAAGLSANLYLWRSAGSYFSAGVEQMPLMHLWSLSVEEQFYLLTPLVFLLARWRLLGGLGRIVLALTALSLAIAVWGTFEHPTATFYLAVTRAWEFGVGAFAALTTLRSAPPRWTGIVLLVALAGSLFWLDEHSSWLPLTTGLPALLTALWLMRSSGPQRDSVDIRWLRTRWLCWIGERSYAWYLLHWPFVVFYRKYYLEDVGALELLMVSIAALVVADAAHRWIEYPARFGDWAFIRSRSHLLSLATVVTALVVTLAFALGVRAFERQTETRWQSARAFDRWAAAAASQCLQTQVQSQAAYRACTWSGSRLPQTQQLILWGDSHAYHLRNGLQRLAQQEQLALSTWAMGGCPPVIEFRGERNPSESARLACTRFARHAHADILEKQARQKTIVILAARWEPYLGMQPVSVIEKTVEGRSLAGHDPQREQRHFALSLQETVRELTAQQVEVILVAPVPEQRVPAPACVDRFGDSPRCLTTRSEIEAYRESTMQMLRSVAQNHPTAQIIDPLDAFCDASHCRIGPVDALWYVDDDHLSEQGTQQLIPALRNAIAEAKRRIETVPTYSQPRD